MKTFKYPKYDTVAKQLFGKEYRYLQKEDKLSVKFNIKKIANINSWV